jgi:Zn-dependent metalloprotease
MRTATDRSRSADRSVSAPRVGRAAILSTLLASLGLGAVPATPASAQSPTRPPAVATSTAPDARITASFTDASRPDASKAVRPAWVEDALARSLEHLQRKDATTATKSDAAGFALRRADRDALGQVHLRLDQVHDGVPVYGGQVVAQVVAGAVLGVAGRTFGDAGAVDTAPAVDADAAMATARAEMADPTASAGEARLVVLPQALLDGSSGATLCYLVELTSPTAGRHRYFVDARSGALVWDYYATAHGTGRSLYSGTVDVTTRFEARPNGRRGKFYLADDDRWGFLTVDSNDMQALFGTAMSDRDDSWGDGTTGSRQSAAVDAHYGAATAWDYFANVHGYRGIDNQGSGVPIFVHYDSGYNNAFWNGSVMAFGDGDGARFGPLVSLDIVGHEYTHAVTEKTANLEYVTESGAANESFSDIFGTALEPRDSAVFPEQRKDYQIGEDCFTPGTPDDAMRNMADPPSGGSSGKIDHYSKLRRLAAGELPQGDATKPGYNDAGYVHSNSGIQNKAFFLLAEGGTHPASGIEVQGIGRPSAEKIFFRALSLKLFTTAQFADVRAATLSAAADLYGGDSPQYASTGQAWGAVGVGEATPPDLSQQKVLFYASYDGSAETGRFDRSLDYDGLTAYGAGSFGSGWTSIVGGATDIFYYRYEDGMAAVGMIDAGGTHHTPTVFPVGFFARNWSHVMRHEGSLVFYNEATGRGAVGRLTGPRGFTQYGSVSGFSLWWTHIVSVQGRILFYNANTGAAAVCDLEEVYDTSQAFRTLTEIRFKQLSSMQFAAGWSDIVDTGGGILFYNKTNGAYVVGDIDAAGIYTDRVAPLLPFSGRPKWTYSSLGERWSHVIALKDGLVFYDVDSGQAMKATMFELGNPHLALEREPVEKGALFTLAPGWTHVVTSIDPLF